MTPIPPPVARGPLLALHCRRGATKQVQNGWEVAVYPPPEGSVSGNRLVDLSHRGTYEINGPETEGLLSTLCGKGPAPRAIHAGVGWEAYRLTPSRAVLFGGVSAPAAALDVTGGWASLALSGPDAERILNKVTAVDLRETTLPAGTCCQGPVFGVNTLFGRFPDRFELHVCSDSAEFFCEVLLDAGREYDLELG
ncbi:MAG: hypothetical protein ACKV0T_30070 [Planctomycetales bacterium]